MVVREGLHEGNGNKKDNGMSENNDEESKDWWVYVLWSEQKGVTYVGATNDPDRRLKQHKGELSGGAKFTASADDWKPLALYGPYESQGKAFSAEAAVKQKTGKDRAKWSSEDSDKKKGAGPDHPWIENWNDG